MLESNESNTLPTIPFKYPKTDNGADIDGQLTLPYDDINNDEASLKKYFDITKFTGFEKASGPKIVKLDNIYLDKTRADGVLRGAYYMRRAYESNTSLYETYNDKRREPILVEVYNGDGKIYKILDGHSTYENARLAGWPKIYVVEIQRKDDVEKAKAFLKEKKQHWEYRDKPYESPLPEYEKEPVGGYNRYKYKSRRYKRNKHYSKKNHTKKNHTKKYRQTMYSNYNI